MASFSIYLSLFVSFIFYYSDAAVYEFDGSSQMTYPWSSSVPDFEQFWFTFHHPNNTIPLDVRQYLGNATMNLGLLEGKGFYAALNGTLYGEDPHPDKKEFFPSVHFRPQEGERVLRLEASFYLAGRSEVRVRSIVRNYTDEYWESCSQTRNEIEDSSVVTVDLVCDFEEDETNRAEIIVFFNTWYAYDFLLLHWARVTTDLEEPTTTTEVTTPPPAGESSTPAIGETPESSTSATTQTSDPYDPNQTTVTMPPSTTSTTAGPIETTTSKAYRFTGMTRGVILLFALRQLLI